MGARSGLQVRPRPHPENTPCLKSRRARLAHGDGSYLRSDHYPAKIDYLRIARSPAFEDKEVAVVAKQTLHRWRLQYGGLKASDAKRPKELAEHAEAAYRRNVAGWHRRQCWELPPRRHRKDLVLAAGPVGDQPS